jgi:hypothetical protein
MNRQSLLATNSLTCHSREAGRAHSLAHPACLPSRSSFNLSCPPSASRSYTPTSRLPSSNHIQPPSILYLPRYAVPSRNSWAFIIEQSSDVPNRVSTNPASSSSFVCAAGSTQILQRRPAGVLDVCRRRYIVSMGYRMAMQDPGYGRA